MKTLLLTLLVLASSFAHASTPDRKFKIKGYEFTVETVEGAEARRLFRVLRTAGFPVTVKGDASLLVTSAINCNYHDPERDGHWITEHCSGGESWAVNEDVSRQIAPNTVNVPSFPNEMEVLATLPGSYITSDMGRGIVNWEKVSCEMSATAVCAVTFRSDL